MLARSESEEESAHVAHEPTLDFTPCGELETRIEALCADVRAEGRRVERLPVYRVGHWKADAGGLQLQVGRTDYGVVLAQQLRPEWFPERLPTLSVCALTMCGEQAVVERRSGRVAISAGLMHIKPSGGLQPPEQPLRGLYREAAEELGLHPDELVRCQLLGLVLCRGTLMDVVYRWEVKIPLEQVLLRAGADAWEHESLLPVDCRRNPLEEWCRANFETCSPPGHAAFMLEGRRLYGEEWFAPLWRELTDKPAE